MYQRVTAGLLLGLALTGCGTTSDKPQLSSDAEQQVAKAATFNNAQPSSAPDAEQQVAEAALYDDLYEVHKDGRAYIFYDQAGYLDFLKLGETPYMISRIGAGPNGETQVFSLTKDDKAKSSGIPSIDLKDGRVKADQPFYGEVVAEERFYVFDRYEDMVAFLEVGEANLRYVDIGAGPKGATVVYVLNKSNKKEKPVALIGKFKQIHSSQ
jgi:hypothetical protein